jgi:hypothetical protein
MDYSEETVVAGSGRTGFWLWLSRRAKVGAASWAWWAAAQCLQRQVRLMGWGEMSLVCADSASKGADVSIHALARRRGRVKVRCWGTCGEGGGDQAVRRVQQMRVEGVEGLCLCLCVLCVLCVVLVVTDFDWYARRYKYEGLPLHVSCRLSPTAGAATCK